QTYNVRAAGSLVRSTSTWVIAASPISWLIGVHVAPPSSVMTIPPLKFFVPFRRNIFGRGRSCDPLIAAQARPSTPGSKASQYVLLIHDRGIPFPFVALRQLAPPSTLSINPTSVLAIKR